MSTYGEAPLPDYAGYEPSSSFLNTNLESKLDKYRYNLRVPKVQKIRLKDLIVVVIKALSNYAGVRRLKDLTVHIRFNLV